MSPVSACRFSLSAEGNVKKVVTSKQSAARPLLGKSQREKELRQAADLIVMLHKVVSGLAGIDLPHPAPSAEPPENPRLPHRFFLERVDHSAPEIISP